MNSLLLNLPQFTALIGLSLLLSAIVLRLLLQFNINKTAARSLTFITFVLSFITISGDSITIYLHGLLSDLSISSLALSIHYLITADNSSYRISKQNIPLFYLIALSGLFFYPAALGLGMVDPYSWGFINYSALLSSLIFISLLAILIIFAFIKQYSLLLLTLVLCLAGYQLRLLESQNLWDYLFDPIIFIYALLTTIVHFFITGQNNDTTEKCPEKLGK